MLKRNDFLTYFRTLHCFVQIWSMHNFTVPHNRLRGTVRITLWDIIIWIAEILIWTLIVYFNIWFQTNETQFESENNAIVCITSEAFKGLIPIVYGIVDAINRRKIWQIICGLYDFDNVVRRDNVVVTVCCCY